MGTIGGSTTHLWVSETLGYDAYARILADTVSTLHTPVNIGIYAGWGSGKTYLLRKIRGILMSTKFTTTRTNFHMSVWLLIRLFFFRPPKVIRNKDETRFIAVDFNALEYAGSDHLWAGLVTKLAVSVEAGFGLLASGIFRAKPYNIFDQNRRQKQIEKDKEDHSLPTEFSPVKLCGIPWWILFIITTFLLIFAGVALLVYAFAAKAELEAKARLQLASNTTASPDDVDFAVLTEAQKANASISFGAVFLLIPFFRGCKLAIPIALKVIHSQSAQIKKLVSKPDFTQELGVMAKVKSEIYYLTQLIRYMELFEGRKILIAIFIDDLDKLPQQTIAPLMQAINLLLSEPNSRFVSFIAMDPEAIANALEMGIQSEFPAINISGHRYLKRLIQVPFSIPEMNINEKREILSSLIEKDEIMVTSENEGFVDLDGVPNVEIKVVESNNVEMKPIRENTDEVDAVVAIDTEKESLIPKDMPSISVRSINKDSSELWRYENIVHATEAVMQQLRSKKIFSFINTNLQEMTRLVGITKVTVRILFCRRMQTATPIPAYITCQHVAVWIVLVAHWPYRLTWMVEYVEGTLDSVENNKRSLWKIYQLVEDKLTLPYRWKNLMKLDEDPIALQRFLILHESWLNVAILRFFLPNTISLDRSLKDIVATASIERQAKLRSNIRVKTLSGMTTDDVIALIQVSCAHSPQLSLYIKRCRHHNIDGMTLQRCELPQLKSTLKMLLGDWVAFERRVLHLREDSVPPLVPNNYNDINEQIRLAHIESSESFN